MLWYRSKRHCPNAGRRPALCFERLGSRDLLAVTVLGEATVQLPDTDFRLRDFDIPYAEVSVRVNYTEEINGEEIPQSKMFLTATDSSGRYEAELAGISDYNISSISVAVHSVGAAVRIEGPLIPAPDVPFAVPGFRPYRWTEDRVDVLGDLVDDVLTVNLNVLRGASLQDGIDTARAFAAFTLLNHARQYANGLDSLTVDLPSQVVARVGDVGDRSYYLASSNTIYMDEDSAFFVDVVFHEFGHWVAQNGKFESSLPKGANHKAEDNLRVTASNKPRGVGTGYSEGVADWIVFDIQSETASPLSDKMTKLQGWNDGKLGWSVFSGTYAYPYSIDILGATSSMYEGEDNQGAVARTLWTLRENIGRDAVVALLVESVAKPGFKGLSSVLQLRGEHLGGNAGKAEVGKISEDRHVSVYSVGSSSDGANGNTYRQKYDTPEEIPTFSWSVPDLTVEGKRAQFEETSFILDSFAVRFFDANWSEISVDNGNGQTVFDGPKSNDLQDGGTWMDVSSASFDTYSGRAEWKPTEEQWAQIAKSAGKKKWVVESVDKRGGIETGPYWSGAKDFDVQLSVNTEGFSVDEQQTTRQFVVSIGSSQSETVILNYEVFDGTAAAATGDFSVSLGAKGTLEFTSGQVSKTVDIAIVADGYYEGEESFSINITPGDPEVKLSGTTTATASIRDVKANVVTAVTVVESEKMAYISGTVTPGTFESASVFSYRLTDGPAAPGAGTDKGIAKRDKDYSGLAFGNFFTIPARATAFSIPVPIVDDKFWEESENFTLEIDSSLSPWLHIGDKKTTVTIQDDEGKPKVYVEDGSYTNEGIEGATHKYAFTVGVTGLLEETDIEVNWSTAGWDGELGENEGLAKAGKDYVAVANEGPLKFDPLGKLTRAVYVTINGDDIFEYNELFKVVASKIVGADPDQWVENGKEGKGTINNDEKYPIVKAVASIEVEEGDDSDVTGDIGLTLNRKTERPITIKYKTVAGTAVENTDYVGITDGEMEINDGDTGTITVTVKANDKKDDARSFEVQLLSATPGELDPAFKTTIVNIKDDDNHDPEAVDDDKKTDKGQAVNINAAENDTDEDEMDSPTVCGVDDPANGTAELMADGTIQYTPDATFVGTEVFGYTITDGETKARGTITIEVREPLDAVDDTGSTNEYAPTTVAILANDEYPASGVSVSFTQPAHGSVSEDANGDLVYTPSGGWSGEDSFQYTITDDDDRTDTATVTITVSDVPGPDAVDDADFVNEYSSVTISPLLNDLGNGINLDGTPTVTGGTITVNTNTNQITFTPSAGATSGSIGYTIKDSNGESDSATITITINDVPGPDAVDDTSSTDEYSPVTISPLGNDTGNSITLDSTGTVTGGTISVNGSQVIFTPTRGASSGSVQYTIKDANGETDSATINITISDVPRPTAVDDSASVDESSSVVINVLGNDSGSGSISIAIDSVGTPSHGWATIESGQVRYTPTTGYVGSDTFGYTIKDANGETASATVTVTVNSTNQPPTISDPGPQYAEEGVLWQPTISASDPNSDPLTFTVDAGPSGVSINSTTGQLSWTPGEADGPGTYSVTVSVSDGRGGSASTTFSVTVYEQNQAPTIDFIAPASIPELQLYQFTVSASDLDQPGQTLAYSLSGAPTGASIDSSTGVFSWTPSEDQGPGVYDITVEVSDGAGGNASRVFRLDVYEVNNDGSFDTIPPQYVNEGDAAGFTAYANPNGGGAFTYSLSSAPAGATIDATTGVFSWQTSEEHGPGDYSVTVIATRGSETLQQIVAIHVYEVNVGPSLAFIAPMTIDEGGTVTLTASGTDPDVPTQALTYSLGSGAPTGASIDSSTGAFSWTTTEDDGPGIFTFSVIVTDSYGATSSQTVTIEVYEVNQGPILDTIGSQTATEGQAFSLTVSASDPDRPTQTLTYSLGSAPSGMSIDGATGAITWTPTEQDGGQWFTVQVTVTDSYGATSSQSFQVYVNEDNQDPTMNSIGDQTATVDQLIQVQASASDPDAPQQTLSYGLVSGPAGASIDSSTGLFSWTPTSGDEGNHTVTISVSDGVGGSDQVTFTITVNAA